jgi:hypothetical protein
MTPIGRIGDPQEIANAALEIHNIKFTIRTGYFIYFLERKV